MSEEPKIVRTAGEIFADGSAIELVSARDGQGLELLHWESERAIIAPQIDVNGRSYRPLELTESLQSAIRFPSSWASYGSSAELLKKIGIPFERHIGFLPEQVTLITAFVISTWFPECWLRAPDLIITGTDMDLAINFLRLLSCVSRHPLILAGVGRNTPLSLPMNLHLTLLINQPDISPRVLEFFRTSNYRDVFVPAPGGHVSPIAGPKVLFLGAYAVETATFRMALPSRSGSCLHELDCRQIASELQPQLLGYRLHYLSNSSGSRGRDLFPKLANTVLVPLQSCVQGDEAFASRVAGIVHRREQEVLAGRSRTPGVAMVEVVWAPSHLRRSIQVKEITRFINTLIRSRGERYMYSEVEVGCMLGNFGLPRHRNGSGMVLRFSHDVCRRLHELAVEFGLALPKRSNCLICTGDQVVEGKTTLQAVQSMQDV